MNVQIEQLLNIGIALSKEKDGDSLLELILKSAMDITHCDAGTLYIKNGDALSFKLMVTKSMGTLQGGRYGPITLPPVPLRRANVCACAALDAQLINVTDVYRADQYDFSGPRKYDAMTGYRTVSMLVVPMEDDRGNTIGVLQLMNAMDHRGAIIPFAQNCEQVIQSLASQAAISLTNMNYSSEIEAILNSFVRVMSTAIDARTPYNANHTRNMVAYGERFLSWLDNEDRGWTFDEAAQRQFLMCVWLHDVGKLTTPLEIMDKNTRLGSALVQVLERFRVISLLDRLAMFEGRMSREEYDQRCRDLDATKELVLRINEPGILSEQVLEEVEALAGRTYTDENGAVHPWFTVEEMESLTIRRGTLTQAERKVMEDHVTMTSKMLAEVRFTGEYAHIPEWAGLHHEFLNGHGYPFGLAGDDIPKETRLLTILDVFDALTARDRPYKQPMPVDHALDILDGMAAEGQIDSEILALFEESRAWEDTP